MPIIGGKDVKLGLSASIVPEVTGGGTATAGFARLQVGGPKPQFTFAGRKWLGFGGSFSVGGKATWTYDGAQWTPGGSMTLAAAGSANVPPRPVQYYVIVPVGPMPVPVPVGYLQGNVGLSLNAALGITDWTAPLLPQFNSTFTVNPKGGGRVGLGLADVVSGEFNVGGSFPITFQYPGEPTFQSFKAALRGSLKIVLFVFEKEWPVLDYKWDLYTGGTDPLAGARRAAFEPSGYALIPRDYMQRGYATFHPGGGSAGPRAGCAGATEQILQSNVYPYPQLALAAIGDEGRLVWIYDDPARSSINRTELVFSASTVGVWSPPVPIADDGTADFSPTLTALPSGDLLAAWENANALLNDQADLATMLSTLEISVADYDDLTQTWSAQTTLTSNNHLDRSPRVDAASNGTAMLAWVSNAANDVTGTTGQPNAVEYSLWDGVSWSAPGLAAAGVPSIVKSDMAFDGLGALYLYAADTDDDPDTDGDQELYALSFDGVTWSAPQRLTNDAS